MLTTKFTIEDYLAEYLQGKWGIINEDEKQTDVVRIPENVYLFNNLANLIVKKPDNVPEPEGNFEIIVPHVRDGNKHPKYHNYVGERGAKIFNKKVKLYFRSDLHEFIDSYKHDYGGTYLDACYEFVSKYKIKSIDPDSLAKDYSRWRKKIRDNRIKKSYSSR